MRSIVARLMIFAMTVEAPYALLIVATPRAAAAQQHSAKDSSQANPRWAAIRQVFGQGEAEGKYEATIAPHGCVLLKLTSVK